MKEKGFIIDVVVSTEYERMSVIDPMTRQIAFEGNIPDAMEFLKSSIEQFKNQSKDESK